MALASGEVVPSEEGESKRDIGDMLDGRENPRPVSEVRAKLARRTPWLTNLHIHRLFNMTS